MAHTVRFASRGAALLVGIAAALPLRSEQPDVHARIVVPETVVAGSSARIAVELSVGPGWHVNSHAPHEKFLIPTDLQLSATAGAVSPVRYPAGVDRTFPFSDSPMSVYEGTVRFEADLAAPAGASGDAAVSGSLSFQACNDRQCFPPAKIPLSARIAVAPGARTGSDGGGSPGPRVRTP